MKRRSQIIVTTSDFETRQRVAETVARQGFKATCCSTVGETRRILARRDVSLVFSDRTLADGSYRDLLAAMNGKTPQRKVPVVLISSLIDPDEYHSARRSGLFEVIDSPCRATQIEWMVIRAKRDELLGTKRLSRMTSVFGRVPAS